MALPRLQSASGIYQFFAYPDLMRIEDTTEIAVRSIPLSSSPPHPTHIASGEWLLGNICSKCMGLSYASRVVCSCADQQLPIHHQKREIAGLW